jgi:hypothetical protein
LDPRIAILCDQGKIEDYESKEFESVVEKTIPCIGERRRKPSSSTATKTFAV